MKHSRSTPSFAHTFAVLVCASALTLAGCAAAASAPSTTADSAAPDPLLTVTSLHAQPMGLQVEPPAYVASMSSSSAGASAMLYEGGGVRLTRGSQVRWGISDKAPAPADGVYELAVWTIGLPNDAMDLDSLRAFRVRTTLPATLEILAPGAPPALSGPGSGSGTVEDITDVRLKDTPFAAPNR